MADNVYSNAKIISKNDDIQKYELGNFVNGNVETNIVEQAKVVLNDNGINGRPDPLLNEVKNLAAKLQEISQKVSNIETNGIKPRDVDAQVVQAIKDLKHYAAFFE